MFVFVCAKPSETPPKREQLSAKLTSSHFSHQNLAALHVNQLNLDSSILGTGGTGGRLNFRNKSASSSSESHQFAHSSQLTHANGQFAQLQSIYQLNQAGSANAAGSSTSINSLLTTNNGKGHPLKLV